MKRLWMILLALTLVVALCSCDLVSNIIDNLPKDDEEETDEPAGNETEEAGLPAANEKLDTLAKTSGYECTMTVYGTDIEEGAAVKFGAKGETSWFYSDDSSGVASIDDGTNFHIFMFEDGTWNYTYSLPKDDPTVAQFDVLYTASYLTSGAALTASMTRTGTTTVAGRACSVYTTSAQAGIANVSYTAAIDNEYGLLLKLEVSGRDSSGETGEGTFEVTEFSTNPTVPEGIVAPDPDHMVDPSASLHSEWGEDAMSARLPQPDFGSDAQFVASEYTAVYSCSGVFEKDVKAYIATIEARLGVEGELDQDEASGSITYSLSYEDLSVMIFYGDEMFSMSLMQEMPDEGE